MLPIDTNPKLPSEDTVLLVIEISSVASIKIPPAKPTKLSLVLLEIIPLDILTDVPVISIFAALSVLLKSDSAII